ncbi:YdcF family protein [Salinibacterium sp. G-O1]|uniref:YdcF family protein n=1 Tax=Salinibacterium sp. G-O1 TaxID=3046208 RepID=UPI0024BA11CE|nr:YdcF family protein [Salinibacterium sp. G-O1]MDJ0336187.1 YdcF family protein [Salinibacterium sp. G-O1]
MAVGLPLYVVPSVNTPEKTDVIYIIGPPDPSRIEFALTLIERGISDSLMVSTPDPDDYAVCREPQTFTVYCKRPSPFTTQGEARDLRDLSAEQGWTSATVITMVPHVTRARIVIERCFTGTLLMVPDTTPMSINKWVEQYVYQTAAFVKVAVNQDC